MTTEQQKYQVSSRVHYDIMKYKISKNVIGICLIVPY